MRPIKRGNGEMHFIVAAHAILRRKIIVGRRDDKGMGPPESSG